MDNNTESGVRVLHGDELLNTTADARVVAIRWDLVPWGLVLDLECPVSERAGAPLTRVWLLFDGVSEVTWPMVKARVPAGCWLGSGIGKTERKDQFTDFRFSVQLATFTADGNSGEAFSELIEIRAQSVRGVGSMKSAMPDEEYRTLDRATRIGLSGDEAMLRALTVPV